jgi:hypothetical protein
MYTAECTTPRGTANAKALVYTTLNTQHPTLPAVKGRSSPPRTRREVEVSRLRRDETEEEEEELMDPLHIHAPPHRPTPARATRRAPSHSLPTPNTPTLPNCAPPPPPPLLTHTQGRITLDAWHRTTSASRPKELLLRRRIKNRGKQ